MIKNVVVVVQAITRTTVRRRTAIAPSPRARGTPPRQQTPRWPLPRRRRRRKVQAFEHPHSSRRKRKIRRRKKPKQTDRQKEMNEHKKNF